MSPQTGFTAILAVAFNTYREAVRSKVLYSILFFGLFIIGFAAILGELSLYQNERVIKDVGLFALSLFGNLMAIFLGVSFLYKEIERKSIYNIVSKPIHRWQYFIGKFAGIIGTLWLQLFFMLIVLTLVLFIWAQNVSVNLFIAFWLVCVEVTVVCTIALLFSAFSTPYLSGFMTLGAYLIGKSSDLLQRAASGVENEMLRLVLDLSNRVVPALHIFSVSTEVTYDLAIPGRFVYHATIYGLCYAAVMLLFGALIFSRRDFA